MSIQSWFIWKGAKKKKKKKLQVTFHWMKTSRLNNGSSCELYSLQSMALTAAVGTETRTQHIES